jgi:hypothetical protein
MKLNSFALAAVLIAATEAVPTFKRSSADVDLQFTYKPPFGWVSSLPLSQFFLSSSLTLLFLRSGLSRLSSAVLLIRIYHLSFPRRLDGLVPSFSPIYLL